MVRHVGALSAWTAWLPLFPAPGGVPFSLAVIVVYIIFWCMSIDIINKEYIIFLCILYIDFLCILPYNSHSGKGGLDEKAPSTAERGIICR